MLHVFVPQNILAPLDFRVAEQVIDVAKIVCPPRAARTVHRTPQTTPVYFSSLLQRTVEQNVDIPVAGGSGAGGGLSGFLPVLQRCSRPSVSPNPGGGLQNFQPVQDSPVSSSVSHGHAGEGVSRTFPQMKKSATLPARSCSALPPHSSPWTPAPYGVPMVLEEEEEEESELDEAEEVEEVALAVEYVECDGRWWGKSGARRRSSSAGGSLRLMALSSATPSGGLLGTVIMLDKFQQSWFLLWKSLQSCSSCSSSPCRMCSVPRFSSSTECWTFQLGTSLTMHSAHCAQDRLFSCMLASTVDTCSASLFGAFWKNCTHFLHEGGTQILKSTLRRALHSRSGEVCTVDASIAEQLHLEI